MLCYLLFCRKSKNSKILYSKGFAVFIATRYGVFFCFPLYRVSILIIIHKEEVVVRIFLHMQFTGFLVE